MSFLDPHGYKGKLHKLVSEAVRNISENFNEAGMLWSYTIPFYPSNVAVKHLRPPGGKCQKSKCQHSTVANVDANAGWRGV
ncbi:hypothetical protein N7510_008833 [Penicillium lagena]|uniref:uncharacterized protein n=1 Tax=Penicillium lagena TaxID=94218 RepID=UPI00254237D8|nr:uncharacterized protein N7510_008833 [Penicillium lagena]KAJ5606052.1 hypothetical protein N7510_008833 [Penicillium lagena]